MPDQATALRNLVRQCARREADPGVRAPRLLGCFGGQPGVGCTTLAVNLSIALGRLGGRVVLVDADLPRAEVAATCGLTPSSGDIVDVLHRRTDLAQTLCRGPEGIELCLARPLTSWKDSSVANRLPGQLRGLGGRAELVVVDAGSESNPLVAAGWHEFDHVLLCTTPDPQAVMNTYATVKFLGERRRESALSLVVNQAACEEEGKEVHARIARSCREFLGQSLEYAGTVLLDRQVGHAVEQSRPCLTVFPRCPASVSVERLASGLWHHPTRGNVGGTRPAPRTMGDGTSGTGGKTSTGGNAATSVKTGAAKTGANITGANITGTVDAGEADARTADARTGVNSNE